MASEDNFPFSGEVGDYIVIDEVMDGEYDSEAEDADLRTVRDSVYLNNSETAQKMEAFSKQESVTERNVSENAIESIQDLDAQVCDVTETDSLPGNQVVSEDHVETEVMNITSVKQKDIECKETGVEKDQNDSPEGSDKNSIPGTQIKIEETVELCPVVSGSEICNITDQRRVEIEIKDVNECENEVNITKTPCVAIVETHSEKESVISESYDQNKPAIDESVNASCLIDVKTVPVEVVEMKEVVEAQSIDDVKTESEIATNVNPSCLVDIKLKSEKGSVKLQAVDDGISEFQEENTKLQLQTDAITKSDKEVTKAKDRDDLWDKHVLLVRGIPSEETMVLKQVLNQTLGSRSYRIKPHVRGIAVLYVHFKCKDEMQIAHRLLHNQKLLSYRVTTRMLNKQLKRKAELDEGVRQPPAKKAKQGHVAMRFLEGTYEEQIAMKMSDAFVRLKKVTRDIVECYPEYSHVVRQRRENCGGIICCLDNFTSCTASDRFLSWCKFSLGRDDEQGEPVVGFKADNGSFLDMKSVKHNYPAHVVEAAKVFEKVIRASTKAAADPGDKNFWNEVIIRTNETQDLMFVVCVYCSEERATGRMTQLHKEMTEFFNSEEGKNCRVTSVYIKVFYKKGPKELQLVTGLPYLEQTIMGIKLRLLPSMHLWSNIHACEMICKGVAELLAPTEKTSVLDVFCGQGLIGLYLSKSAGEVLCLDMEDIVQKAEKNAELNNITNCRYFGGKPDEEIPQLAANMKFEEACAVVIIHSHQSRLCCLNVIQELRRMKKLKRVVLLVTTHVLSRKFNPIVTLCDPANERGMGDPFFPARIMPIDTLPMLKSYILLILMERTGLPSLSKNPEDLIVHPIGPSRFTRTFNPSPKHPHNKEKKFSGVSMKGGNVRVTNVSREPKEVFCQREESGPRQREREFQKNTTRSEQYWNKTYSNDVGEINRQMEEEERRWAIEENRRKVERKRERRMKEDYSRRTDEEQRRKIKEEEYRRRLEEKEHLRKLEEEQRRKVEEHRRKLEKERRRKFDEEHRRKLEDERKRKLEEEQMRQIEEEKRRKLKEEHRRKLEEEQRRKLEEHRRKVEEEHRRQLEEEHKRKLEEEHRRKLEEEHRRKMEEEHRRKLEEERRRKMEEEKKRKLEEEQKRKLDEEKRRKLEEEHRRKLEEEHRRKLEEEHRRKMEEHRRKLEEEHRRKVEQEHRRKMEEEHRRKLEEEHQRKMEEEHRRKMEEEHRRKMEEERRRKMEEEHRRKMEEEQRRKMEEEQRRQIEEERRKKLDEENRKTQEEQIRLRLEKERQRWLEEEHTKVMQEDECRRQMDKVRRQMQENVLGKQVNVESERWMQGEERGMWMNKEYTRQREMERDPSSNLRSRSDVIHGVIGDTLRGSAVPDYTAQQLKRAIAQAIENAGVFGQEEKRNDCGRTYQPTQPDSQRDRKFENEFQRWPDLHRNSQQLSEMYGTNKRLSEMYGVNRPMSGTDNYQHNRATSQSRAQPGPPSLLDLKLKPRPELLGSSTHQRQDQVPTSSRDFGLYARRDQLVDRPRNSPWNASTMENVRKVESSFPAAVQGHPHNFTRRDTSDWTSRGSETMTRQDGTSRGFESGFRNSPYSMQPWDGGSRRTK